MFSNPSQSLSLLSFIALSLIHAGCGNNTHSCEDYCSICHEFFAAPSMDCLSALFEHLCLKNFEIAMTSLRTDWCSWSNVSG